MAYSPSSESNIVNKFNQFYFDAYRTWGVYYAAAYRDLRAYAGDNWLQQEKMYLEQQKRMVLELNKIRRVVNLYSGYERENRNSTVVAPIENADQKTADQLTKAMLHIYDKSCAHHIFSEAFDHSLKTGLSIIGIYMDYSRDKINGDIRFYWKPFNALMMDPYFTKRDLSDCDQVSTRDLLSKQQVKALLPFIDPKVIDNIPTGIRDNKYQYLGIYRQYNSTYIAKNLLTYDQYWVRYNKPQKYIIDKESGISQEFNGTREEEKNIKFLVSQSPNLEFVSLYKSTVELNIIVGGKQMYSGPDPTGLDTFPMMPIIAYFEPLIDTYELKIQGLVRSIRDAQRQYNRRHSQIIDLMESVINTGWIHKNGAVIDPTMLFISGAGRNVVVNEGYDVQADVREINPPNIPPGYLAYQDIMDKNIIEIPGGNDEILGLGSVGDSQVSGRLAEVRASNGLKGNRGLFDNYEMALKNVGDLVLKTMQKNYTAKKVANIIGEEPTAQFLDQNFEEFHCTIQQAVLTQTQREAYYYQLLQLRQLNVGIPDDEIVAAAPLVGKTRLIERMQKIAEQQEQAAIQEQEDAQIQRELVLSQKAENIALAQERRARVVSDIALAKERISESEQNHAKALLDNARTVAEMEDMDRRRIIDVINIAKDMHAREQESIERQIDRDIQRGKELAETPSEAEEETL